jgi:type I restriction enzyme S subunit
VTRWPTVPLADALRTADVFTDGDWVESKDQDRDGEVRLVQLADIGDSRYLDKSSRFMNTSTAQRLKCTFLKPGDLLMARMPDPLGRVCIFPGDHRPSVTVVDVCIIRPDPAVHDARWLMHCLNARDCRAQIQMYTTGTTRSRISRGNLAKVEIPMPPIDEQRRIADILDRADTLRAKRREAVAHLDDLIQSIFLDMFGDPLMNPNSYRTATLAQLGKVVTGRTPPGSLEGMFGDEVPFVTPGDLERQGRVSRFLSPAGADVARIVRKGATLVCCIGATIGKTGYANERSAFNQQINAVEWSEDIEDRYGYMSLRWRRSVIASAGASTTMPILKKSAFEQLTIPVPPLELQSIYARRISSILSLKATQCNEISLLDGLFAALQHRAFAGQL